MTNPYAGGSALPSFSSTTGAGYRRSSYASVAAGTANVQSPGFTPSTRTGLFPHASTVLSTSNQQQQPRNLSRQPSRDMDMDRNGGYESWARGGKRQSQWSSQLGRYVDGLSCQLHDDHPPFFTPSYLRGSRHVERLEQAYHEHVAELQENVHLNPPKAPPLSTSSSNVNLSKMHTSHIHRGVVQDVIERMPPHVEEDKSHSLPSRWNDDDKMSGLEIMADGTEVRFNGQTKNSDEAAAVRSDHPMPKKCGLYYFEVTVLSRGKDGLIGIGFSSRKVNLNRLPGWETESWAYHGDDGFSFACTASGKAYGPKFSSQDVIGCGVNFRTGNAFFTKNGIYLGVAFHNVKGDRLFPSVGMKKPGEHLRINFGHKPFVYDIDSMMEKERQTVMEEINKADPSCLHPPDEEDALIQKLIGQYLAHEGYVETTTAFAEDLRDRQQSLANDSQSFATEDAEDDVHAISRQKIRKSILDGDVDKALKYTSSYYPHVLEKDENKDIYFRLRCRKFIEMMRRCTELQSATPPPAFTTKAADLPPGNGHGPTEQAEEFANPDGSFDQQMELDDQLHREANLPPAKTLDVPSDDVDMDASQELPVPSATKSEFMKQNDLLTAAIEYGRELQAEFGGDPRHQIKKQLSDIFAIMAYTDPRDSVVGQLLDPKGRVPISEEVNGAILKSLGKPSSAALEKLCAQTETLLTEATNKNGGATALINMRRDFLQP